MRAVGCQRLIEYTTETTCHGLAMLGIIINPPLIVIGGRMALTGEILLITERSLRTRRANQKKATSRGQPNKYYLRLTYYQFELLECSGIGAAE